MKKENLIILGLLAVGIYFYFNKKKKENEPYSDSELDKKINELYVKSNNLCDLYTTIWCIVFIKFYILCSLFISIYF